MESRQPSPFEAEDFWDLLQEFVQRLCAKIHGPALRALYNAFQAAIRSLLKLLAQLLYGWQRRLYRLKKPRLYYPPPRKKKQGQICRIIPTARQSALDSSFFLHTAMIWFTVNFAVNEGESYVQAHYPAVCVFPPGAD